MLRRTGSRDRQRDGRAAEQPGQRNLQRRGVDLFRDAVEEFVRLAHLAERSPGNEGDAVLLAMVEEVVPLAVSEAVAVLYGDDGDDFAGALDVFEGDVGERDVADLALGAEVGEGFHGGVEGDGGVGDVELVDVDALEAQAAETAVDGLAEMFGAGVVDPLAGTDALPSAFGGDNEAGGVGVQGLGDEFFGDVGAVGVGGVDEVDAEFDSAAQRAKGGTAVGGRSPDAFSSDAHGPVAEAVNGEIAEVDVSGSGGVGRGGGSLRGHRYSFLSWIQEAGYTVQGTEDR